MAMIIAVIMGFLFAFLAISATINIIMCDKH